MEGRATALSETSSYKQQGAQVVTAVVCIIFFVVFFLIIISLPNRESGRGANEGERSPGARTVSWEGYPPASGGGSTKYGLVTPDYRMTASMLSNVARKPQSSGFSSGSTPMRRFGR